MTKFTKAVQFASLAHEGQTRKGTDIPYIVHPLEVASIVATITTDEDVLCAAVLHDTVEDTSVTIDEIEKEFGSRVAALVAEETEDKHDGEPKNETWTERKDEALRKLARASEEALIICLGDKLSNLRAIHRDYVKLGDKLWDRFNASCEDIGWYYCCLRDIFLMRLPLSAANNEFRNLVYTAYDALGIFKREGQTEIVRRLPFYNIVENLRAMEAELGDNCSEEYHKTVDDAVNCIAHWFWDDESNWFW